MQPYNTIFITGVSSEIGRVTAEYFASKSWKVFGTVRNIEQHSDWAKKHNIQLFYVDVTDLSSIQIALKEANAISPIQVVVNNAGYGADGIFESMSDEFIEQQFNTNVFGLMRVTREALPYLRASKGLILQISSIAGRVAFPLFSIYNGTKWAIEGFSESLRYELLSQGIQIKMIEPGAIKTEFFGSSRKMMGYDNPHYKEVAKAGMEVFTQANSKGKEAIEVAEVIYKAATDGSDKFRYPIGGEVPILLFLRKLLPFSLFFKALRKAYKL